MKRHFSRNIRSSRPARRSSPGASTAALRAAAASLLLCIMLGACSKKEGAGGQVGGGPDTVVYRGVLAGNAGDAGTLTLTQVRQARLMVGSADDVTGPRVEARMAVDSVTVQINIGGAPSTIRGRFDSSSGSLIAAGSGYALNGSLTTGRFSGTYSRPGRNGGFVALIPATSTIRAYCGDWSGTRASGVDHGSLGFVIDGTVVFGAARNDDGTLGAAEGSMNAVTEEVLFSFPSYTHTGSRSGTTVSGTYTSTLDQGRSGTWTTTACPF